MTHSAKPTRRYKVHARHVDSHHARLVEESSFEAAAVAYLEKFDLSAITDDREISIIVQDLGTGHEHCFRLDLDSGATSACA